VRLRTLVDHLPVAVYLKDTAGRKILSNPADLINFGARSEAEVLGKTDFDLFPLEQAALYYVDDQQVLQIGEPVFDREEKLTKPDGSVIWNLTSKVPLRDAAGRVTGLAGVSLDITTRKRLEEAHERLATAVEQSAESIVITDTQGIVLYANPAFEKTSGYTRAEVLGQNPRILKSGKQNGDFYHRLWSVLERGEIWSGHFTNRRKDGTFFEEEATISPVRDAAGKVVNYVAVKRDVTREVELEAQVRQSQKMEAIGQLAGGVAHDFNNILAVIQLQVGLLKVEQSLTDKQEEYADDIEKAAQRAADLTRQLLLFSRKQAMQMRDQDLNVVVTGIAKMLQRVLGENIQMQLTLASHPLWIHADASMIDQVLMNLAVNARDAMRAGGQLRIETCTVEFDEATAAQTPAARPGAFVCVSVRDTGTGIAPEILPRIFEPFFTTKDVGKGTGLGLATVFGIVQQHQGWIIVSSELGQGTTFRVYLPRLQSAANNHNAWSSLASIQRGHETILLVEDDAFVRASTRATLLQMGYRVLEAGTGAEAVEIWNTRRKEVDLLLTDLLMPGGMTGKVLAEQLRQSDPKLKVIYVSGYSADITGHDFRLDEGVNFLSKPFEPRKLAQTIRNYLDKDKV
jgi:PAS domain S-box-containing protein